MKEVKRVLTVEVETLENSLEEIKAWLDGIEKPSKTIQNVKEYLTDILERDFQDDATD